MGYKYEEERPWIFTDEGQRQFLAIRDHVDYLLSVAGVCTMGHAIEKQTGSSWQHMACVDRLVELGELRCIRNTGPGQYWVYERGHAKEA